MGRVKAGRERFHSLAALNFVLWPLDVDEAHENVDLDTDMDVNVDRARQHDDVSSHTRLTRLVLCLPHNNLHNIRVRNQQQQQQQQQGTVAQQQRTISTIQCRTHLTRIFSLSQDATRFLLFSISQFFLFLFSFFLVFLLLFVAPEFICEYSVRFT